jgi:hypothetical protein
MAAMHVLRFNLKANVGVILATAVISPFVYFNWRAVDVFDHAAHHYQFWETLFASAIALLFFACVAKFPRFARWCSRDPDRVSETIFAAICATCIFGFCFLLALACVLFGR